MGLCEGLVFDVPALAWLDVDRESEEDDIEVSLEVEHGETIGETGVFPSGVVEGGGTSRG